MLELKGIISGIEDHPIRTDGRNDLNSVRTSHWIQHRVLTFDWSPSSAGIKAGILLKTHNPGHDTNTNTKSLEDFISDNLNYAIPDPGPFTPTWDIDLPDLDQNQPPNETRILILQLDNARDWEFTPDKPGIRAKEDVLNEDCSVYFVDTAGKRHGPGGNAPENCRMIYWSVIGRFPDKARGFNFYISLIDVASRKKVPSVFDPNVPNGGGASIP